MSLSLLPSSQNAQSSTVTSSLPVAEAATPLSLVANDEWGFIKRSLASILS
jgi:hypothetical protein